MPQPRLSYYVRARSWEHPGFLLPAWNCPGQAITTHCHPPYSKPGKGWTVIHQDRCKWRVCPACYFIKLVCSFLRLKVLSFPQLSIFLLSCPQNNYRIFESDRRLISTNSQLWLSTTNPSFSLSALPKASSLSSSWAFWLSVRPIAPFPLPYRANRNYSRIRLLQLSLPSQLYDLHFRLDAPRPHLPHPSTPPLRALSTQIWHSSSRSCDDDFLVRGIHCACGIVDGYWVSAGECVWCGDCWGRFCGFWVVSLSSFVFLANM